MVSDYGVRDRIVARWRALNTGMTEEQIRVVVDSFVDSIQGGMTMVLAGGLMSSQGVVDAWEPTRFTQITEAVNDEVFKARLEALQHTTDSIPQLPGLGLPLGYLPKREEIEDVHYPILTEKSLDSWRASTLTKREVCMINAVERLTNQKDWWTKCEDPEICESWKQELLGMDWPKFTGLSYADFTPEMVDAVLFELREKAVFYKNTGLIPVMDFSATVVKSDTILTDELTQVLKDALRPLEEIPEDEKDWREGSNHQILDLVDPFLWPLVYGKTRFVPDKQIGLKDALDYSGAGVTILKPLINETASINHSRNFQWLPCDVSITSDGKASISSYINNLHPVRHAELYPIIEDLIEKALPAWDFVYRYPSENALLRIDAMGIEAVWNCTTKDICQHHQKCSPTNRPLEPGELDREEHPDEEDPSTWKIIMTARRQKDLEWINRTHVPVVPAPGIEELESQFSSADVRSSGFFDAASKVQVIVQIFNVHLSPDSPTTDGGSWNINGLLNEHICATALYYYDSDNIAESKMDFRTKGNSDDFRWELRYKPREHEPIKRVFAIDDDKPSTVHTIGSVLTRQGQALFFPNIYQHRFSPFRLTDATRPGHCKVLALYLVDPKIPIISTSNVGPQQRDWWEEEARLGTKVLSELPAELQNMVLEDCDLLMNLEEAKEVRAKLVQEWKSRNEDLNADIERDFYQFL